MPNKNPMDRFLDRSFSMRSVERVDGAHELQSSSMRQRVQRREVRPVVSLAITESDAPTASIDDPIETAKHRITIDGMELWLEGNNVLCACPDCAAPITIQIWLGLADCWRCGTAIEMEEATLEAARELVGRSAPAFEPQPTFDEIDVPRPPPVSSVPSPRPTTTQRDERLRELEQLTKIQSVPQLLTSFLSSLPAWLVSFLFHLFMILILALLVLQSATDEPLSLVLSTFLDESRTEGGTISLATDGDLADDLAMDALGEMGLDADDIEIAKTDAADLTSDPNPAINLPDLSTALAQLKSGGSGAAKFSARDPRFRQEIVEREGGTLLTEAAVARGLRWLASVQNADGSWSLERYSRHNNPKNKGDAAGTSLALLPFLGAGQTHEYGIYKDTVSKGLAWLIANQKSDGDLRINFTSQAGMYAHGQAAICLCEAYALTGDERFREPAAKAIAFIESAQHREGGWRYTPGQAGDTSVFGWQLMALQSARYTTLGKGISDSTFRLANYYLDAASRRTGRNVPDGALYRYQPNEGTARHTMTAEALLCRMYMDWKRDDPRMMYGVRWLLNNHLPDRDNLDLYYWYYGTQVMHHYGGTEWETWNRAVRDLLVSLQETRGKNAGSWEPDLFERGNNGERIYTTAFAVCTLEVYYRHLPLFRTIDLERNE
ncbi:MAG: prenyltransferase/squalene oxidase repeat-containing protein [Pirellulaceae bacterium]